MTTVPQVGSEWIYNKERVVVEQVYVQYHYTDLGPNTSFEGALASFQDGGPFKPAPLEPVIGKTYVEKSDIDPFTFVPLEVLDDRVYGREKGIGGHSDRWYAQSYTLKTFAGAFEESK